MNVERLKPLQDLAESREQDAAERFARHKQALEAQEQRLSDLQNYQADYRNQMSGAMSPSLLRNRQDFMSRLNDAVRQQGEQVARARQAYELERQRWVDARGETQVLDKLEQNYQAQAAQRGLRREQFELDELAARLHRQAREQESST